MSPLLPLLLTIAKSRDIKEILQGVDGNESRMSQVTRRTAQENGDHIIILIDTRTRAAISSSSRGKGGARITRAFKSLGWPVLSPEKW